MHALTIQEPQVSDRDWLEERFQKMEQRLQNDMRAQIASVQVTTQRQQGDGRGRGRGGFRGRGRGNRGGYRGAHQSRTGTSKMNNRVPRMIMGPSMKPTIKMMIGIHPKLFVTIVVGLDITRMVVP